MSYSRITNTTFNVFDQNPTTTFYIFLFLLRASLGRLGRLLGLGGGSSVYLFFLWGLNIFLLCKGFLEGPHNHAVDGSEGWLYPLANLDLIIKYNRWQQRNRSIIHNVTSVKYNKENEIFSYLLTCFPRLN